MRKIPHFLRPHLPSIRLPHNRSLKIFPTKLLHHFLGRKIPLSILPAELLVYIFEYLSLQDVCTVVGVCRSWRFVGYDGYLWKSQSLKYFENPINRGDRKLLGRKPNEHWKTYFTRRYISNQRWKNGSLPQRTITGHAGTVWTLAFDNEKLVTGSFDTTVKIWNRRNYKCSNTLRGHSYPIQCLQFIGNILVTGSLDNTIRMWDTDSGEYMGMLVDKAHNFDVFCLQFNRARLVSGSSDSTVKVWNMNGYCMDVLHHSSCVTCLHFEDNLLITGSADKNLKIWDLSTGKPITTLSGHLESIRCLQREGNALATGSNDHTIKTWDLRSPPFTACTTTIKGHSAGVRCLQLHGAALVSGSADRTVRLWDIRGGGCAVDGGRAADTPVSTILRHPSSIVCLQWMGNTLACGFSDSKIKILSI